MGFKPVSTPMKYVKYSECEEGQVLATGTYLGHRQGTYGIQHQIRTEEGISVLNSSGQLNWVFENSISVGDYIRVTFLGKEKLTKGKFKNKEVNRFEVEIDAEKRVDGANLKPVSTQTSAEEDDDLDADAPEVLVNSSVDDDEEGLEAQPQQRTKVSSNDILKRYKKG